VASWTSDGQIWGYDPASNSPQPIYYLATNAIVDPPSSNGGNGIITRMQYVKASGGSAYASNRIRVQGQVTFVANDFASNLGKRLTVTMFFAPATLFPENAVPSAFEVLSKGSGITAYRASASRTGTSDNGGILDFSISGPWANQLQPNAKYWVVLIPTAVSNMGLPADYSNDIPISGLTTGWSLARGVSLWTNRTPRKPTITSPANRTIFSAGSTSTFTFTPDEPDTFIGAPANQEAKYDDVAGVQVQYAAQPTVGGPPQVWIDVPIMATAGSVSGNGWYIDKSTLNGTNPGALVLWRDFTIPMAIGSLAPAAGYMALPTGDWQLRMRTFDYGHPYAGGGDNPLFVADASTLIPSRYPAVNTSPWSDAVSFSVTAQVPPVTPLSPINDVAIVAGTPVTLSWLYRNTYTPPYVQATRTIQMRKLGDTAWTTVLSANVSALSTWLVSGFSMTATNCYEWRVQVTDSSSTASNWSLVGRFWVVNAPGSGAVLATPTSTVDGATLGCGTHRVVVFRRGGLRRVGEIRSISHVDWSRLRDDISTAQVVVSGWDDDCGNLLSQLQTWAYEIAIYRTTAFGTDRVWEGPITKLTYESDKVTIDAKDVMGYAYRRIIKTTVTDSGKRTVVNRAAALLQTVLAPDDPNLLAHLRVLSKSDDQPVLRTAVGWAMTLFDEIDGMAAQAGLDYTVVGRSIMLWGTKHRIGTLPEFRDKDLGAVPIVSEYGMSAANVYSVSDGNGTHGEAYRGGVKADGSYVDPVYGLLEMVSASWASAPTTESGTYTQEEAQAVQKGFEGDAERSISDRYTPPVIVRLPDGTTINPDAVINIQQLVPGVIIPLRSTGTLRNVVGNQKLDSVKVVEESGKETISITLSPYNRDDAAAVIEGV
jgi:hypothetical protein